MIEQEREGRNVVTGCPNMDMFRVVWKCRRCARARLCKRARRRENEGIAAIEVSLHLYNFRE